VGHAGIADGYGFKPPAMVFFCPSLIEPGDFMETKK